MAGRERVTGRRIPALLVGMLTATGGTAVVLAASEPERTIGHGQVRFNGLGPERWAARYRAEHRRFLRLAEQLEQMDARTAIRLVFGTYANEALRVAWCETGGTLSPYASNGQYLGLFQMGATERARYGYGVTPIAQTLGAYVYFVTSGRSWRAWTTCQP